MDYQKIIELTCKLTVTIVMMVFFWDRFIAPLFRSMRSKRYLRRETMKDEIDELSRDIAQMNKDVDLAIRQNFKLMQDVEFLHGDVKELKDLKNKLEVPDA